MPATRKMTAEASQQDLDQLQNLFSSSKPAASPIVQEEAPKKIETVPFVSPFSAPAKEQIETVAEIKKTTDTTVGIRMTSQKKREVKAYFIQKGTTLSQGVMDAYNLLRELEKEGLVYYKDGELKRV